MKDDYILASGNSQTLVEISRQADICRMTYISQPRVPVTFDETWGAVGGGIVEDHKIEIMETLGQYTFNRIA